KRTLTWMFCADGRTSKRCSTTSSGRKSISKKAARLERILAGSCGEIRTEGWRADRPQLEKEAAGEFSPPSRSLTGPGQAPALSLRAGTDGFFIVWQTGVRKESRHVILWYLSRAKSIRCAGSPAVQLSATAGNS